MQNPAWPKVLTESADPSRARHFLDLLAATDAAARLKAAKPEQARVLAALFSGSPAMTALLIKHPGWLDASLTPEALPHPRQGQGLRREVDEFLRLRLAAGDWSGAFSRLREFKQREMLRLAVRDLAGFGGVTDITLEISNVADVCLDATLTICQRQLAARFGTPWHQDADEVWRPTAFSVLGLGKLGGQELNYSSDVDVIFVYSEEGHVFKEPPRKREQAGKGLTNHQFFTRLVEACVAELTRLTPEGSLFRVDLRLRPEGDAGPLVRSLEGYENYYAQWGQTWERMMLIKARGVAGDAALAGEFLEMVQPFRYPRSLGERTLSEVAAMKRRIEVEVVKAGELDRNVKLGRGGIREIEFVAQALQLLHAGRQPFLQNPQTLPALQKLAQYHRLPDAAAARLAEAYVFLRQVEHRLQMEDDRQTHTIPTERKYRERLARLMGCDTLVEFETVLQGHRRAVREVYEQVLQSDEPEPASPLPGDFVESRPAWLELLAEHSFREPEQAFRLLHEFANGPGFAHVSPRTTELAARLIEKLLALCPPSDHAERPAGGGQQYLSDPDRVAARLDSFIQAYGARAALFETWTANPSLFELLVLLFDRSEFLAETAIRTPDLVDDLVLSGRLRRSKTAPEILRDLQHGSADADQRLWLRQYHRAELMRIGLRDILGLADFEHNLEELSALADACLQYALAVLTRKHGFKSAPLAIIGLGKLGGREINYGSDLDILFVTSAKISQLPKLQTLAAELMDLLSGTTELGATFATDARLRPDGEKGLLVNTLAAHEDYYRHRARLWEIQALTRVRAVAGEVATGKKFEELAARLTDFRRAPADLAAYLPDWKGEIARMRTRIEKERTPPGQDELAIKTGAGGLMDAEFLAQALCLANGWSEANTLRALERARDTQALPVTSAEKLIANYRSLRRVEGILRRWSFAGETLLPEEPAAFARVAVRCGFTTAAEFRDAVAGWRQALREVNAQFFVTG